MRQRKIDEIMLPYKEGVPLHPSVTLGDRIINAIELMVTNNQNVIAVVQNKRPIGTIYLKDAFKKIGLDLPKNV